MPAALIALRVVVLLVHSKGGNDLAILRGWRCGAARGEAWLRDAAVRDSQPGALPPGLPQTQKH